MCITSPLSDSLITAKSMELEKVSLIDMQNLGLLVNTLAAYDKYQILNRDNLMIRIEMHLFQKQKLFSLFSATFLKSRLNLNGLKKKMTLIAFPFPKLRTPTKWLHECLKSPV